MNQTSELKERKDHGTAVFPCGLYEIFDDVPWDGVKHHWHDEIEILYFMKGSFKVTINMEAFSVDQECFFFVNPGEIPFCGGIHLRRRISGCISSLYPEFRAL